MKINTRLEDYYEIVIKEHDFLHIRMRKFWSKRILDEIGPTFLKRHQQAVESLASEKFVMLIDCRDFGQPSEEMKSHIMQAMEHAIRCGLHRVVEILPSKAVLKMAIDNTAKKVHEDQFRLQAGDLNEANRMVRQLRIEIQRQHEASKL